MQDKPYRKINFAYPATPLNSAYSSVIDFIKPSVRDAPAPIIQNLVSEDILYCLRVTLCRGLTEE